MGGEGSGNANLLVEAYDAKLRGNISVERERGGSRAFKTGKALVSVFNETGNQPVQEKWEKVESPTTKRGGSICRVCIYSNSNRLGWFESDPFTNSCGTHMRNLNRSKKT